MIGYQDPTLGKKRRQALSEYLRQQSSQRAQSAGRMRGISTRAFGASSGNTFLRGGSRATPEKFAFAGAKPSLKTLLGLVGRNLGFGGTLPDFRVYGPDAPVTGLPFGGNLPTPPPPGPSTPTGGGLPSPGSGFFTGDVPEGGYTSEGGWTPTTEPNQPVQQVPQYTNKPYSADSLKQLFQMFPNLNRTFTTPILGTLKYDQLQ